MHVEEVLAILVDAVHRLLKQEELVYADNNEPALSIELYGQMRGQYPGWNVNAEWDKFAQDPKLMDKAGKYDGELATVIRPDVVVHRVGERKNLLVVEMKRDVNKKRQGDIDKLIGLTRQDGDYGYAVGVHLIVNIKASIITGCDAYIDGAVDADWTAWLRERLP
ncbi:hypothetical protein [Shinella sp. G-2]|uniref:hypothetical protein n=1 Tax=Shinella sp. G-2 TaxID=3133141 RepID=UPI003D01214F